MIVAVTGASGLLGRHVCEALLACGHSVTGIDVVAPTMALPAYLQCDMTRLDDAILALRGADAVVHVAAIPRPTGRVPHQVFSTNVAATYNVVEACVILGIERLVYASSFSVIGFPFNPQPVDLRYLPLDENHPVGPQDSYALSKWLGEEIVDSGVRRRAFAAVSLRMPWIQTRESFQRDVVPLRSDRARAAGSLWSYLDGSDAGSAFVAAVESRATGHLRLFLSAADTFMEEETEPLVREAYPDVPLQGPLAGHATVVGFSAAHEALGFTPRRSWRDY